MKKKKREIPVPDPNSGRLRYDFPAASWGDMTGLIPSAPASGGDISSYADVYPCLPDSGAEDVTI